MNVLKASKTWMLLLFLGLSLVACQEDDLIDIPEEPTTESPAAPQPDLGPGDGAFWAINAITTTTQPVIGSLDTEIGTAVAVLSNDNFNSYIDAGDIQVMGNALTKNENKSYTYIPGTTQPLGLQFPTTFDWSIGGSGSVTAFNHTVEFPFPDLGKITSAETVTKADGYTLTCESVGNADAILFLVGGVVKEVAGDVTSVDFTASELAGVSTGTNFIQIAAYTYKEETIGGKTYYFGNETVRSVTVEVK